MERRSFLRGLVASIGAGTALVKLATPEETRALTVEQPVGLVSTPKNTPFEYIWPDDGLAYARRGDEFVPIGYITSLEVSANAHEAMSLNGEIQLVPGLREARAKTQGWLS